MLRRVLLSFGLLGVGLPMLHAQFPEPNGGSVVAGVLPRQWLTGGPRCMEMQEWQAHEYNPNFVILRQSGCTDYEKPFVYLLFGKDHALLYDTGSRKGNITPELKLVVHNWLTRNSRASMPLYVTHSHNHGDHTAGDKEIQAMNDPAIPVTFVAASVEENGRFYGIKNWPEDIGSIDLGDRVLDAIAIPGHEAAGIALYDRQTGVLLTGDSVYPGRIYISDFDAYGKSIQRMVRFTEGKPVAHVLGTHIEQTRTPFLDYTVGTIYQPNEHCLELSRGTLLQILSALEQMHGTPKQVAFEEFTLEPRAPRAQGGPPRQPGAPRPPNPAQTAIREYGQKQQAKRWDGDAPDTPATSATSNQGTGGQGTGNSLTPSH